MSIKPNCPELIPGAKPANAETFIDGYTVSLEFTRDAGDLVSNCYIERGSYSASLECADATGELENAQGRAIVIEARTVDTIRQWAEARGY